MELHQKTWLQKRSFILLPNKLKLHFKDVQGEHENYISYEKLKTEAQIRSHKNEKLLFLMAMAIGFTICIFLQTIISNTGFVHIIFPSLITLILVVLYRIKKQEYIIVETVDRKQVVFLNNKPNRKALEKFLDRLWLQRKRYLREKYFYISHSQDVQQQVERLRWLLEQKAIDRTEFKFAKDDWVIDKSYQSR